MVESAPPPDDSEDLLASLDDLRTRIEAAQAAEPPRPGRRWRGWVLGVAALVIAVLVGSLALRGDGDDNDDLAAGGGQEQATTTTAPTTTTTAAPTTTTTTAPEAAPPTTAPSSESDDAEPPVATTPSSTGETWTVVPGDNFWSIAERLVADRLGHEGSPQEVTTVWVDLMASNADRLVEPGNPNLIFPGQVLVLPASAASP